MTTRDKWGLRHPGVKYWGPFPRAAWIGFLIMLVIIVSGTVSVLITGN